MSDTQNGEHSSQDDSLVNNGGVSAEDTAQMEALEKELMSMTTEELEKDPQKQEKLTKGLKEIKTMIAQKNHWREKAEKGTEAKPATSAKPESPTEESIRREARTDFRIDHPDISKELVVEIEEFANANKMTLEQAYKRPLVQKRIEDAKRSRSSTAASPSSSYKSNEASDTGRDWSQATNAEVAAHRREILSRRK